MNGEGQSVVRPAISSDGSAFDILDLACIAVTATVAVAVLTKQENAVRAVAAFIFALFIPGRAVVSNWPSISTRAHFAVSILFSLTLLVLVATITLWSNYWHPLGLLEVECLISAGALLIAIVRRRRLQQEAAALIQEAAAPIMDTIEEN